MKRFAAQLNEKVAGQDELTKTIYYLLLQASLFSGIGITMDQLMEATHKTRVTIKSRLSKIPQAHYLVDKNEKPFHYRLNMKMLLGSKEWFTQALRWPESLKSNVKSHSDCKSN